MRVSLLIIMVVFVTVLPWSAPPTAAQGGIVIDAVDNDPDNKLWNCETNWVPFGNEDVDKSRCFSFRYQVPPEGIKSATLHVSINTLGAMQETDSTVVAVGESFSDCAWAAGGMAGCIGLHGGFEGSHRSLNLNLLDIACDPSVQGSPEKQQALIEQLQTGVLHFLLQDDTAVYGAKLVLNGGPPSAACGASEQPISETLPSGEQSPGGTDAGSGQTSGSTPTSGSGGPGGSPWDTPVGQNCFEQWIREAMSRLNAYDGGDDFNARKPWSINQYGILEGNPRIGPTSVAAPDNFADYNYNKYWWMWDQYPAESVSDWRLPEWRGARVPSLRAYVRNCVDEAGGTGGEMPPGSAGTSSVPGDDVTPPDFGSPEPASVNRMTLQAGQRQVLEGGIVNVPVWLINGTDVANINFTINYDASVAVPEGDLLRGSLLERLFEFNTGEAGLIRVGFAQTTGINGTGTITYVPFRAVGEAGDRTELNLGVTTINDPDGTVLTIDRINGAIQIVRPDGRVPGDCPGQGDGILDEFDASCALRMSVDLMPVDMVLDMDDNAEVTSRDATIILQRVNRSLNRR